MSGGIIKVMSDGTSYEVMMSYLLTAGCRVRFNTGNGIVFLSDGPSVNAWPGGEVRLGHVVCGVSFND